MTIYICYLFLNLAAAVITLTMMMRANDQRVRKGLRWHMRLLGFVMAGCGTPAATVLTVVSPDYALPFLTISYVGIALVFMTTPGQKPWLKWLWKGDEV